ncbi:MAG: hypothetical protein DMG17_29930, partial [Acidobacteria bacterium]
MIERLFQDAPDLAKATSPSFKPRQILKKAPSLFSRSGARRKVPPLQLKCPDKSEIEYNHFHAPVAQSG